VRWAPVMLPVRSVTAAISAGRSRSAHRHRAGNSSGMEAQRGSVVQGRNAAFPQVRFCDRAGNGL